MQREGSARYLVACERFVGGCEASTGPYPSEPEAIRAWNAVSDAVHRNTVIFAERVVIGGEMA